MTTPQPAASAATPPAPSVPAARWATQKERSNRFVLRVGRAIAVGLGRRTARLVLHPIALYYLIASPDVRRHSRRYLERALGRPARWTDVYRHLHTFVATVLDRIYLLRGHFDEFRYHASGVDTIMGPFKRGEGVLTVGAHLGSFEALRMIGQDKGLEVAVIMYEDNARLINETLAAIAPKARLVTIPLGTIDAMLTLRRWLDGGGVAGMLADRTLAAGDAQRSKTVSVPFLGTPALFPDGPFRLAAMLRRKVVFMTALYRGGRDYDMRFTDLADFSQLGGAGGAARDAAVREAVGRYVQTLEALCREAPYNWFNFFDYWAEDDARDPAAPPTAPR